MSIPYHPREQTRNVRDFVAESYPPPQAQHLAPMPPTEERVNFIDVFNKPTIGRDFNPFDTYVAAQRLARDNEDDEQSASSEYYYEDESSEEETNEPSFEPSNPPPQSRPPAPLPKQSAENPLQRKVIFTEPKRAPPKPPINPPKIEKPVAASPVATLPAPAHKPNSSPPKPRAPAGIMNNITSFLRGNFWPILTILVIVVSIGVAFLFFAKKTRETNEKESAIAAAANKPPGPTLDEIVAQQEQAALEKEAKRLEQEREKQLRLQKQEKEATEAKKAHEKALQQAQELQQKLEQQQISEQNRQQEILNLQEMCEQLLNERQQLQTDNNALAEILKESNLLADVENETEEKNPAIFEKEPRIDEQSLDVEAIEASVDEPSLPQFAKLETEEEQEVQLPTKAISLPWKTEPAVETNNEESAPHKKVTFEEPLESEEQIEEQKFEEEQQFPEEQPWNTPSTIQSQSKESKEESNELLNDENNDTSSIVATSAVDTIRKTENNLQIIS